MPATIPHRTATPEELADHDARLERAKRWGPAKAEAELVTSVPSRTYTGPAEVRPHGRRGPGARGRAGDRVLDTGARAVVLPLLWPFRVVRVAGFCPDVAFIPTGLRHTTGQPYPSGVSCDSERGCC
jgi:hypothetical protein